MAGKAPAFQFYIKDWLSDPLLQRVSANSRGIWINLLCYMWESDKRGLLKVTPLQIMKLGSAGLDEVNLFLNEIHIYEFGNLVTSENQIFPITEVDCNTEVTLVNRRMFSDYKHKENTRLRVQKYREKKGKKQKCNAQGNGDVTPSSATATATALRKDTSFNKVKEVSRQGGNHFSNKVDNYLEVILSEIKIINSWLQNGNPLNPKTFYQWVQEKVGQNGHPKAIYKSLAWLRECLEGGEDIRSFRAFVEKTYQTVNPNFHGRDAEKESQAFKNVVIDNKKIKEILEGIG